MHRVTSASVLVGTLCQLLLPRALPTDVARALPAKGMDDGALREHADDVADYTLHATLDTQAHTVHGEGSIHWRNASDKPVRELWLHLYLNAFKNERSVFLRERVGGRGSVAPDDWGAIDLRRLTLTSEGRPSTDLLPGIELSRPGDDDETDARVPLPFAVMPGESIALDLAFDDKLPTIVERTGYAGSFHMVGQWFPKLARLEHDGTWAHFPFHHLAEFYADFGTYDVTLDVPSSFTIGATGPVVDKRVVAGRLVERHVQSDIHDFAWAAWNRWQTAEATIAGVEVKVLYPPGFEAVARRDMAAMEFALPYESGRYGRYPYPVLTVVHPQEDASEAGGMEYPTLITGEGAWWTPPGVYAPEIVAVHELGHQWFYGLLASNEAAWPFLDEGLNQYAEVDAMAAWKGDGSAGDLFGLRVSDAALQAVAGNQSVHDEPVAQPASAFSTGANYGALVYSRTASVMETLARVYGRGEVARALALYARRFRFEHPGPDDLLSAFADAMGAPVAATLRTALFDEGWVDFTIGDIELARAETPAGLFDRGRGGSQGRETRAREDDGAFVGSVLVRRRGTLVLPVEVELVFADGSTRREHWNGDTEEVRIPWRGPVELTAARVDPDDRVLIDANPENNAAQAERTRGAGARVLERLVYVAELALQTLTP